jgi:microcystin-dependent protein
MNPYLGQIVGFGGNFAPRGWATCDGQLMAIAENTALFSLLGTIYGGDGRNTFALPDLRGREVVHAGSGPGLPVVSEGENGGAVQFTMTTAQLPTHSHTASLHAESAQPSAQNATGNLLGLSQIYAPEAAGPNLTMSAESIVGGNTGGGQPVQIRSPYQAILFIIALVGVYPPRS